MRRILVTGSRSWTDISLIRIALRSAVLSLGVPTREITLVHGDAPGADRMAALAGHRMGIRIEAHPANWRAYGRSAGLVRNAEMVNAVVAACPGLHDVIGLAFAQAWQSGTGHCARLARTAGITVVDWGADTTERGMAIKRRSS